MMAVELWKRCHVVIAGVILSPIRGRSIPGIVEETGVRDRFYSCGAAINLSLEPIFLRLIIAHGQLFREMTILSSRDPPPTFAWKFDRLDTAHDLPEVTGDAILVRTEAGKLLLTHVAQTGQHLAVDALLVLEYRHASKG